MTRQPTHRRTYQVLVTDELAPTLAGVDSRHYESPPHTEQEARALLGLLVGTGADDAAGPWSRAIAGGRRIVELRARP